MKSLWSWLALSFYLGSRLGPLAFLALPLSWLLRRQEQIHLILLCLGLGALFPDPQPLLKPLGAAPFSAQIDEIRLFGSRAELILSPDKAPESRVQIFQDQLSPGLAPGARALVLGPLKRPPPGDHPGLYDPRQRLALRGIAWRGKEILLLEPAEDLMLRLRLLARAQLQALDRSEGAGILAGLLLGDRSALSEHAIEVLRITGTGHLLAVSGLHVGGLVAALMLFITLVARRLRLCRPDRWAMAGGLLLIPPFLALTQFPLSACRAGLMLSLYLLGRLLGRPVNTFNLLGLTALLLLSQAPARAHTPGFQLSFVVVAALLLMPRKSPWLSLLFTALLATAASAPIQLWHFGTLAPLAPIGNLILTPLTALILLPLSASALLLSPLWIGPLQLAAAGAEILLALGEALASWGSLWILGSHWAFALSAPLLLFLGFRLGWPRLALLAGLLACGGTALSWPRAAVVEALAVGQGDALLLRDGLRAILVDTGPDPRARILLAYLRRRGISQLEALILSHGHPDHTGGTGALLKALTVKQIFFNGRPGLPPWPVPRRAPGREHLSLGRLELEFFPPAADAPSENNASLAIRVQGPSHSLLLTGDLEAAGEAALLAQDPQPVSLLKAAHHGSRSSSGAALLRVLNPKEIIFNTGRDNRFGFPHQEVLKRAKASGARCWRTDRHGLIQIHLDGEDGPQSFHSSSAECLLAEP